MIKEKLMRKKQKKYAEEHNFIFQEVSVKTGDVSLIYFIKIYLKKLELNLDQEGNNLLPKLMILNLILKKILKELRKKEDVVKIIINKKRN